MDSQEHNMVVLGQIFKQIPAKLIEKLKNKYKIQTRSFSETSHVAAMVFVDRRMEKFFPQILHTCKRNALEPTLLVLFDKVA